MPDSEHLCGFYCCPVCHTDLRAHDQECQGPLAIFHGIIIRGLDVDAVLC